MNPRKTRITDLDLDLFIKIAQYLSLVEISYLLIFSKPIHNMLMRDGFWQGRFSVVNYAAFTDTLSFLQDPDLIDTFCNGFMSSEKAIETKTLLDLSEDERVARLFTPEQIANNGNRAYARWLLAKTNRVIIALNEGIMTTTQLLNNSFYIKLLQRKLGLTYLRKNLPRPINLIDDMKIKSFVTPNSVKALEEKLITIEQIKSFSNADLTELLSDEGIKAMRDALIIPELNLIKADPLWFLWCRTRNNISKYIQLQQVSVLNNLLANTLACPNFLGLESWKTSDSRNANDLPYFTIAPSDEMKNNLLNLREKLKNQGIQLIIQQTIPGMIWTCYFSEQNFRKIRSALFSMPSPDSSSKESPLNTETSISVNTPINFFNSKNTSETARPPKFTRILSELLVYHAQTLNLDYRPLLSRLYFPVKITPSAEQIAGCSALLEEAGIKFTFQSDGLRYYFDMKNQVHQTFKMKIKELYRKKMDSLTPQHPEPGVHQPKI